MNMEQLYQERLTRYVTALRNEKPDKIPIRPFVAEFTAQYAGLTCQQVAHDYTLAFEAAVKCAREFDWDAVVANMVYVWTGLTQAAGLRYYGIPGIGIPPTVGFNYIEPPEDQAFMRADDYDALIDDPTGFLYNVWLPRVSTEVARPGQPATYRNQIALVKSGMALLAYFHAFGPQVARLRAECGTVSAIAGIFKAPFDIIGDKLRGYVGLTMDMHTQPGKVLQACEALMPHLVHAGLTTADPAKQCPSVLDASRLRAVCQSEAVRLPLLAHPQAMHRGILAARSPDDVLCRRQMGFSSGRFRHPAGAKHSLPRGPRRHFPRAPEAGTQIRAQRRDSQHTPQLRTPRRSPRARPESH